MAEFLIKAVDAGNINPEKDRACYRRGDIVVVMPDGHVWGRQEGLPKFYQVSIPGLSVELAKKVIESEMDAENKFVARRKWGLLINNLPVLMQNKLQNEGRIEASIEQVKNYLKNKITKEIWQ